MKSKKVVAESIAMVTTAFGLVAALAWNEAIKAFIESWVPKGRGVLPLFLYAMLVTAIAILISQRLIKIKNDLDKQENDQSLN